MTSKYFLAFLIFTVAITACNNESKQEKQTKAQTVAESTDTQQEELDTIRMALDWSPNVLHAGIFYADYSEKLKDNGIYLDWFTTEIDDYKKKPIQRLLDREVDLAIAPSEHLFYFGDTAEQNYAVAIATILQKDQSVFAVKSNRGISSPKELNGKTYIGYNTPLENNILRSMIQNDGGKGEFNSTTPPRLSVWESFIKDKGDVVWIFSHWEGALAKANDQELNYFYPAEYSVPYGYSSVLLANKNRTPEKDELIERFLSVLAMAHQELAPKETQEVVEMLQNYCDHPNFENSKALSIAWEDIRFSFLNTEGSWGVMQDEVWQNYYDWISKQEGNKVKHDVKDVRLFYEPSKADE